MSRSKIIGIVGGVGPFAGLDLNRKIFNQTIARSDQQHLTVHLVSDSSKITDRTQYLLGETDINPADGMFNVIKKLHKTGAEVIGVPCNTSHALKIWNRITEQIKARHMKIELVNMIEETALFIKNHYPHVAKVGLLGTTGTVQTGVYSMINSKAGLELLYPDDKIQNEKVHPSIYSPVYGIKAHSEPVSGLARRLLREAADHLILKSVDIIILGCTEIPLAIREKELDNISLIDPTTILARALISRAAPHKLKSLND